MKKKLIVVIVFISVLLAAAAALYLFGGKSSVIKIPSSLVKPKVQPEIMAAIKDEVEKEIDIKSDLDSKDKTSKSESSEVQNVSLPYFAKEVTFMLSDRDLIVNCKNSGSKILCFEDGRNIGSIETVRNGNPHGRFSIKDEEGNRFSGTFSNGKLVGKLNAYYKSGSPKTEASYIADHPDGEVKELFESGEIKEQKTYNHGLLNGEVKIYSQGQNGPVLRQVQNWKNGQLDGIVEKYDSEGNLVRKLRYESGNFLGVAE